jgi:hypothetical protein
VRHGLVSRLWRKEARAVVVAAAAALFLAGAASGDPFVEEKSGVTVDWRRGAIAATAGAAGDHRMPSADAARPGAERRARAAARARIAEALRALPLGGGRHLDEAAVDRAANRARATSVEYQSNGGALVRMEIAFGDWVEAKPEVSAAGSGADDGQPAPVPILLPQGHLAAAPVVVVGGREVVLGGARYSTTAGMPTGIQPLAVHADKQGRLLVDEGGKPQELAGRQAVIYVQKILR